MEHPDPRIIRPEAQDRISTTRDVDCVSKHCARQVISIRIGMFDFIQSRRSIVCEGIIGSPSDGGFVDGQDVKVMTVLCPSDHALTKGPRS